MILFAGLQSLEAFQVKTDHAEVELISEQTALVPGETIWIGIQMDVQEGWYVYYRNPGDSGMPMTLNWTHEQDFNISDINRFWGWFTMKRAGMKADASRQ